MSFIRGLRKVALGIAEATIVIAALPVLGSVGVVSAAGAVVAAVVGTAAGVADEVLESGKESGK